VDKLTGRRRPIGLNIPAVLLDSSKRKEKDFINVQRELNKRGLILKEDHNEDMDHLGFDNRVLVKGRRTN
jgi:hypothetical protein